MCECVCACIREGGSGEGSREREEETLGVYVMSGIRFFLSLPPGLPSPDLGSRQGGSIFTKRQRLFSWPSGDPAFSRGMI